MTPGTQNALALAVAVALIPVGAAVGPVLGLSADPLRPCAAVAGPAPCFWDAGKRGDRRGKSFILWGDGTVENI